jgi:hypothetical protein
MNLDTEVRTAYSKVPTALKYIPISQSIVDSPGTIMNRTTIEILYLKSIIVLHRQYIAAYRHNPLFNFSRHACLQAAEAVLQRQVELHEATQPGCQLYDQRWMVSALTTSDFILAAMIICLELTIRTHQPQGARSGIDSGSDVRTEDPELARHFSALEKCWGIWATACEFSTEARVALGAIDATIQRIRAFTEVQPRSSASWSLQPTTIHPNPPSPVQSSSQEQWPIPNDETAHIDWVSNPLCHANVIDTDKHFGTTGNS